MKQGPIKGIKFRLGINKTSIEIQLPPQTRVGERSAVSDRTIENSRRRNVSPNY